MEHIINQEYRKTKINIIAIREFLKMQGHFDNEQSEAIAQAIDLSFNAQEDLGLATKGDIKHLEDKFTLKFENLNDKVNALPDKIMWQIVKYGAGLYAVIRVVEFVVAILLKKSGV